jgi:hypothetical protein
MSVFRGPFSRQKRKKGKEKKGGREDEEGEERLEEERGRRSFAVRPGGKTLLCRASRSHRYRAYSSPRPKMELTDVFLSILWWYVQMGLVVDVSGESSQIAAPFSKIFESLLKSRDEVGDLSVEISPLGHLPTQGRPWFGQSELLRHRSPPKSSCKAKLPIPLSPPVVRLAAGFCAFIR